MQVETLHVIFVCYNCGADIVSVLQDLSAGNGDSRRLSVTVVDNASSDDSLTCLRGYSFTNLNIISSPVNLGFAGGCNLAFDHLPSHGRVLLLNPDVRVPYDSIDRLISFSTFRPECLIWGGITVDSYGNYDGKCAWREPNLLGIASWAFLYNAIAARIGRRLPGSYTLSDLELNCHVDAVSGCFMLVDIATLKRLGGFDETFFMYSEEIDFCRRARNLGAKPAVCTDAVIEHAGSATLTSSRKQHYLMTSKSLYLKKHWPSALYRLAMGVLLVGSVIRMGSYTAASLIKPSLGEKAKAWRGISLGQAKDLFA
ncbi:glycosyltransferase family 2 protein [Biformimicrobium ophioploci]|uniref:Glycosyltransferase 2-like domain-containing protein n=1 Tax=Biformimicrobium ophioploci TaxID=3036711 RepID=A0ABQ6M0C5_9GAMM|nr:glycosyltransferase family 2 protein [Microbulbifer sp. NKW57]GMG87747.1 hypothetical protein MNKW57_20680 [Microbulbifer sp. NKW57]